MNLVDFRRGAEAARVTMNQWVEDQTRRKIRELIPSGGLDADTRLVMVNAVYFKGMWVLQFRKAATRDEPFHLEGGGKVQAPLMHQHEEVRHLQAGGYQAVDLVYRGGDLSMLVLLPDRKDGLPDLEKTLSARMLHDCVAQMGSREVKLFLPRFKITWGTVRGFAVHLGCLPQGLCRDERGGNGGCGRQFPSFELTIPSCSPSAIGRAARSCFSGAWPSYAGGLKRGRDAVGRHRVPGCRRSCCHRPVLPPARCYRRPS